MFPGFRNKFLGVTLFRKLEQCFVKLGWESFQYVIGENIGTGDLALREEVHTFIIGGSIEGKTNMVKRVTRLKD